MKEQLLNKINELIQNAPDDWIALASQEMNVSEDAIRKIRKGIIGSKKHERQLQLIEVLKKINIQFLDKIEKVLI